MTPKIALRRFRATDAPACHRLRQRAVHIGAVGSYGPEERAAWAPPGPMPDHWPGLFADRIAWVATSGRRIAGFMVAGRDGHFDLAYTDPDFVRLGVATRLHAQIVAELAPGDPDHFTTEASLLARPFFESVGWQCDSRQSVIRRGVALTNFRMSKAHPPAGTGATINPER